MFDLLVELGEQAVAEGIVPPPLQWRSIDHGPSVVTCSKTTKRSQVALQPDWDTGNCSTGEKDTVIGSLLDRLPPDRVEAMQRQIFQRTSADIRSEQVKKWNLARSLADAVNPLVSVGCSADDGHLSCSQSSSRSGHPRGRRMAQVLGDCMNLGRNPWLPPQTRARERS